MAGGRFKTQGNLCTRLVLGASRPGDLSCLPESDSLCRGLDRGQSCALSRRPRRRPALSRPRPHAVRTAGRADVPRAGRGEDPPMAWARLSGQPVLMSSGRPPRMRRTPRHGGVQELLEVAPSCTAAKGLDLAPASGRPPAEPPFLTAMLLLAPC